MPKHRRVTAPGWQRAAVAAGLTLGILPVIALVAGTPTAGSNLAPARPQSPPVMAFTLPALALDIPAAAKYLPARPAAPVGEVSANISLAATSTARPVASRHTAPPPTHRSPTGLAWPFPVRSAAQVGRTDEGLDLVSSPGGPVLAVASGTVRRPAMADPGGFGYDYAIETLDAPVTVNGRTFREVYYGHTHATTTGHVSAGETVARTGGGGLPRGGNGEPGEVEIGFGNPNAVGGISWANGPLMKAALG